MSHHSLCILLRPTKILISFFGSRAFSTSDLRRLRRKGLSTLIQENKFAYKNQHTANTPYIFLSDMLIISHKCNKKHQLMLMH